ncbi:MAG: type II toxin-antitoxin system Phd/YefM family antitoxin [Micrococcales bacterium]|nr:type II toxin-antitoxin system Phd/YefM family antitoxin [Micrococcales bacterium]
MLIMLIVLGGFDVIKEVNAVAFRQRLGEMLSHVQYANGSVLITRDGAPVAALIDPALFDQIRTMRSRFDELCAEVAQGYASVPLEEGMAEIDAVCASVRDGS